MHITWDLTPDVYFISRQWMQDSRLYNYYVISRISCFDIVGKIKPCFHLLYSNLPVYYCNGVNNRTRTTCETRNVQKQEHSTHVIQFMLFWMSGIPSNQSDCFVKSWQILKWLVTCPILGLMYEWSTLESKPKGPERVIHPWAKSPARVTHPTQTSSYRRVRNALSESARSVALSAISKTNMQCNLL
jgi:hypothetical protein